ncbi:uncharacterized protein [Taeniopygia guttata]|uniref:uncharacterized protein isoform X2 n=1 Tax=Taeniopygia guttata TaxID=59729 RepID=UPI003BB8F320
MVAPRAGLPGAARDAPRQVRPRRRAQRCRGSSEGRGQRAWHSPCSGTEGRTSEGHGNFFSGSGQLMPVTNSCGWDQTAITAEHTNATQCPRPGARRRAGPGRAARSELRRRAGAVRILRGARRRRAGVPGTAPRAAARGAGRAGGGGSALQRVKARARGPAGAVGAAA